MNISIPPPSSAISSPRHLLRRFWPWACLSALCGVGAGAATVALLATVNKILVSGGGLSGGLLWAFVALCAAALVGRAVSDMSTNYVGQRLVAEVRKSLAQKILSAPIDALERYRTHRLMPVLTQDVDMISDAAFVMSATLISLSITLGCFAYLAWLSPAMFALLLVALVAGAAAQALAQARGVAGFWKARAHEETLHRAYRDISEGAKELRVHRARRLRILEGRIVQTVDQIRDASRRAINTYVLASAFGSAMFFVLTALVLGWAAFKTTEPAILSGFVLVLLYLKGPIDQLAGALPTMARAKVAFGRVADLEERFANPEQHLHLAKTEAVPVLRDGIELRDVQYTFTSEDGGKGFALGPLNLQLNVGELVFVVGDNGSGKTTLIKLLLGLYAPQSGQVLVDGEVLTAQARDDYRQLFGTVLSDFYLFDDLVAKGENGAAIDAAAAVYLQRLEIAHKVSVTDGAFSTVDLSTGQRKRLALVHAYMEGRPVLVFDEWAADQDPAFRHLFYTELLPELRSRGHSLVVISHDDRYFHVADRVVTLRQGRIESDVRTQARDDAAEAGEEALQAAR